MTGTVHNPASAVPRLSAGDDNLITSSSIAANSNESGTIAHGTVVFDEKQCQIIT